MTNALVQHHQQSAIEVAASASAALAKATIEAKFVVALRPENRRKRLDVRAQILDICRNPRFAQGAWFKKKQGKKEDANGRWVDNYVEGFSIRFAEEAIQAWRNVDVSAVTAWEDELKRLVRITVTDLESNLSYTDEVLLAKTVERKKVKEGQEVLGKRETSEGGVVYIVRCTDDELQNKVNAAKSKSIRNSGLRLIPADIRHEAEEVLMDTRAKGAAAEDPNATMKRLVDAFSAIGVSPTELEVYMKHPLSQVTPAEIVDLRAVYTAIKDGEATWRDYQERDDDDQIPGAEVAKAKPTDAAEAKPADTKPSDSATPQQKLGDAIIGAGFTFSDFVAWGAKTGNLSDATSLASFDEVPVALANRLLRAMTGLITQLRAAKGGAQ